MQEFICDLRFRHLKVWREADFSCPRAVNKKAVTYHKWCGSSESGPRGSPFSMATMVTMGGDLQPGSLADRLLIGLGQPPINP